MSNQENLIAQFIEITGGEENEAKFFLQSCDWSLEDAISTYLGSQSQQFDSSTTAEAATASLPEADEDTNNSRVVGGNNTAKADDFVQGAQRRQRFVTLNDMGNRSSNEEEGQAFYAGGSERSGQQVLGPPKRKNFREQLTDMFRMAQDRNSPEVPSTSTGNSWGQGIRLGVTADTNSSAAPNPSSVGKESEKAKKPVVILKLWSQGFSINDGELRMYEDSENRDFLETVMRGEIPPELLEMGSMVNVDVEDHRHEDFKKPNLAKTFKGSGHTLGSPVPNIDVTPSTNDTISKPDQINNSEQEKIAKEKLNTVPGEPTTTLQIRLSDGSRLSAQFNLSHTIADIHQYIENARPQYLDRSFILVTSFPTQELKDLTATIESAGLKNAALMQRLV